MALNDVFGVGFRLDEHQLNLKLQVLAGIFARLGEAGIYDTATDEQRQHLDEMRAVFLTWYHQIQNEIKEMSE